MIYCKQFRRKERCAEVNVIYWILMIFLLIVFICDMVDTSSSKFKLNDRAWSLIVALTAFVLMCVLKNNW